MLSQRAIIFAINMSKLWILLILPLIVCAQPLPEDLALLIAFSSTSQGGGIFKNIVYQPIVATNAHIALADDKTIVNLKLQALQMWYEIWDEEPTVTQKMQKEEIRKKLQEATKVVETCPFEEFTDQTQYQAEVVALLKITPSKKKPKLEILTTFTDYDLNFYLDWTQVGPTELGFQCWEYQALAQTYTDFYEKVGYKDLVIIYSLFQFDKYPEIRKYSESNDDEDESSEEQEEDAVDSSTDNWVHDTSGRNQLNLPKAEQGVDEATPFWANVARNGGPSITVPTKNLKKNEFYFLGIAVTFKGQNILNIYLRLECFSSCAKDFHRLLKQKKRLLIDERTFPW